MTSDRDFDRLARAWLELGPGEAPDRVVAAVLQAAETTPQVRRRFGRPFWRSFPMNRLPVVAGAAAILVVAVGGALMLNGGQTGGVGGPPGATPTALPTATPSPSPSPVTLSNLDVRRALPPGQYRVGAPFGAPFGFDVTSDWAVNSVATGEYNMLGGLDGNSYVLVDLIENVYADPCRSEGGPLASPVPLTVDGILAGLDAMTGFNVGPTTDITIDGHAGKEFDLTNSLDPKASRCDGGQMIPIWTFRGGGSTRTNPGLTEHVAIIDVDGTPVAIGWGAGLPASDSAIEDVERVVRGLDFD